MVGTLVRSLVMKKFTYLPVEYRLVQGFFFPQVKTKNSSETESIYTCNKRKRVYNVYHVLGFQDQVAHQEQGYIPCVFHSLEPSSFPSGEG